MTNEKVGIKEIIPTFLHSNI
jgi:hypothetical protein